MRKRSPGEGGVGIIGKVSRWHQRGLWQIGLGKGAWCCTVRWHCPGMRELCHAQGRLGEGQCSWHQGQCSWHPLEALQEARCAWDGIARTLESCPMMATNETAEEEMRYKHKG